MSLTRSIALAALFLCLATAAHATGVQGVGTGDRSTGRTLFILNKYSASELAQDNSNSGTDQLSGHRAIAMFQAMIRATGGVYDVVYQDQIKTEWARVGLMRWGFQRPWVAGSDTGAVGDVYYDAVIMPGLPFSSVTTAGACRIDSVFRLARGGIRVPWLLVGTNNRADGTGTTSRNPSADSSGTKFSSGNLLYSYNGIYSAVEPTRPWTSMAYTQAFEVGVTGVANDVVPILYSRANAYLTAEQTGVNCTRCDSTVTPTSSDSLLLVKRVFRAANGDIVTGVKPLFVAAFNSLTTQDSVSGSKTITEGEFSVAFAALAALDSASGGKVLGGKPIIMAAVMDKGLHRGERRGPNGIFRADTAAHYAIVDSIKANGIPLTVAFDTDPDTATAYARDLIVYSRAPSIRFTPQCWTGAMDSTKANGQASKYRVVDAFGRWRNRAAMGAFSSAADDTSAFTLLKSMRVRGDSILATCGISGSRISRIALAPDDDWSPKLLRRSPDMKPLPDSMLYAVKQAGFDGIIVDVQDSYGIPRATNPRGWESRERNYRNRFLSDFKMLGHSGYPYMGGRAQYSTYSDSVAPFDSLNVGIQYIELCRAWYGAVMGQDRSYDVWPYDNPSPTNVWPYWSNNHFNLNDFLFGLRGKAHILRFSASDFSGAPGAPAANGYHVLKSIQSACLTINKLAGRTIVRLGYPDEIQP